MLIAAEPLAPPSVAPQRSVTASEITLPRLPTDDLEGFDKTLAPLVFSRWQFEPLPSGAIRLKRNAAGRLEWDSGSWSVGLIFPLILLPLFFTRGGIGYAAERPILFWFGMILAAAVGVLGLAWTFWRREEIRAGKGFIERSVGLFGYGHTDRMDGMGVFRVTSQNVYAGRGSRRLQRVLRAENLGKKFVLDRESEAAGLMQGGLFGELLGNVATDKRPDEMTALGKYLSAVTGWPLIDPDKGIF